MSVCSAFPQFHSCEKENSAVTMKLLMLAVLALLVHNGNGDCAREATQSLQNCHSTMMNGLQGIRGGSTRSQNRRACCLLEQFQDCVSTAIKKCGSTVEALAKRAIQEALSEAEAPCNDYPDACSGASSIVPMNAVLMYVLLFLGYFMYVNKF